jgi:hypothetical protein
MSNAKSALFLIAFVVLSSGCGDPENEPEAELPGDMTMNPQMGLPTGPPPEINTAGGAPSSFLGDYKGIDVLSRDIVVTWTDNRNDSGDIYFARARDAAAAGGPLMP